MASDEMHIIYIYETECTHGCTGASKSEIPGVYSFTWTHRIAVCTDFHVKDEDKLVGTT